MDGFDRTKYRTERYEPLSSGENEEVVPQVLAASRALSGRKQNKKVKEGERRWRAKQAAMPAAGNYKPAAAPSAPKSTRERYREREGEKNVDSAKSLYEQGKHPHDTPLQRRKMSNSVGLEAPSGSAYTSKMKTQKRSTQGRSERRRRVVRGARRLTPRNTGPEIKRGTRRHIVVCLDKVSSHRRKKLGSASINRSLLLSQRTARSIVSH